MTLGEKTPTWGERWQPNWRDLAAFQVENFMYERASSKDHITVPLVSRGWRVDDIEHFRMTFPAKSLGVDTKFNPTSGSIRRSTMFANNAERLDGVCRRTKGRKSSAALWGDNIHVKCAVNHSMQGQSPSLHR
jgi:hypothetical protein